MTIATKQCRRCGETKPLTDFGPMLMTADRHAPTCRLCCALTTAERKEAKRKSDAERRPLIENITPVPLDEDETPLEAAKSVARGMSGRIERWTWGGDGENSP